jgi:hypothetical protein
MTVRITTLLGALSLSATLATTASAQTSQMHFGPRIAYHFDAEAFGVGAQFSAPLGRHLEFYPSFDVFLVDAGSFADLNVDLKLRVAQESFNWLYLGAGLNLARRSAGSASDTQTGLNLFAGAESLRGRVHPFAELRMVASNGTSTQLAFGLNFTLHGH